jgi:two-component system sensor histidine kinase/response regulator
MDNLKSYILRQYFPSVLEKNIIDKEIIKLNLIRSFMLNGLAVPIALILSLTYSHTLRNDSLSFIDWKRHILDLNISVAATCSVLFVLGLFAYYKPRYKIFAKLISHVTLLVLALWGTVCTIYDQSVTNSIIAFLVICVVCSLSMLIHPFRLFVYLGVIYTAFGYGISETQPNREILISNLSIGMITMVICLGLSTIQWRSNLTRFKQRRQIKTQKKALEESYRELLRSSEALQQANETKDKFFSILAHDLRGPISSTLALTELLEEGFFEQDESERRRMYKLLQNSLFTTGKLLENVLLWSRSQTGNIIFKPITINVFESIEANINLLKIMAAQKDIKIINDIDSSLYITGDPDMINTIFRNLISNAIKFTPNFGKIEIISGHCEDEFGKPLVTVSVRDYGVGMNAKILENLFRAENKVATPGTNNETGTGLGLVLCKEFIQKHAGDIRVESKEAEGSTFTVALPASLTA